MNPNYRQLARFSSPVTQPVQKGIAKERNLTKLFGFISDVNTEKQERISNRLTYVHQLLKMRKTPTLTEALQRNRTQLLNLLELYVMLGKFPLDYDARVNDQLCFQDETGRRCAVGFLLERSVGKQLADKVCGQVSLSALDAGSRQEFDAWLVSSGILLTELTMIQPNFSGQAQPDTHAPAGVSQAFASLREQSQSRREQLLDAALVGVSPEAVVLAGYQPARQQQAAFNSNTNQAATATAVNPGQTRVFYMHNQVGEPVVAMTFSSSY